MAHLPEGQAQLEYTRMQLVGSLGAVAETMRNCAAIAEQFAQLIPPITYPGAPMMFPNGQLPQMPPPHVEPTGGKRKARGGDEEGEGGKRRRKTKPKDPNAPKRPPSSYLLFQNEVRQELKTKHPNISNNELLAKISKAWSEMPKEQKDRYEKRQATAKEHYEVQKKQYQQSQLDALVPVASAVDPAVIANIPTAVVSPDLASSDDDDNEEENEKDEDVHDASSVATSSDDEDGRPRQPPAKKPKQEIQPKTEGKKEKKKKNKD